MRPWCIDLRLVATLPLLTCVGEARHAVGIPAVSWPTCQMSEIWHLANLDQVPGFAIMTIVQRK